MADKKDMQVAKKESHDAESARDQRVFIPATDIYEKDDAVLVVCDMPGVGSENVDVTLENRALTITGYKDGKEPQDYELRHRGYYSGVYRRTFTCSTDIDRANIKAKISNGVLELTLPKSEEAQPHTISVEAGD